MLTDSDRFAAGVRPLIIPLLAVLCFTGCYRWVPIGPDYRFGKPSNLSDLRLDGDDGSVIEDVRNASLKGLILNATKSGGQPLTVDLRLTAVARKELSPGRTAAAAIGIPLGVLATITGVFAIIFAFTFPPLKG